MFFFSINKIINSPVLFLKDPVDHTIRADVRTNARKANHLYYDGHEFSVNRIGVRKKLWQCSKKMSKRCQAWISTVNLNGVTVMKVIKAEYSHPLYTIYRNIEPPNNFILSSLDLECKWMHVSFFWIFFKIQINLWMKMEKIKMKIILYY